MRSFSSPWLQRGLAFGLGAGGVLGLAPFFLVSCLLFALWGVWFLFARLSQEQRERGSSLRTRLWEAGLLGWFFGWGYFVAGLYWLSNALLLDLQAFWWLIPFSLLGLPAVLAFFIALPFLVTAWLSPPPSPNLFVFAALWVLMEWVRAHIFTGFPWNLLGYTWGGQEQMCQLASFVGVYGLSFLTLLLALSWQWVWRPSVGRGLLCALILFLCGVGWYWGEERLVHPVPNPLPPFGIRLVQPNIPQTLKWEGSTREKNFRKLLELTRRPSSLPLKAVIWPESALTFFIEYRSFHRLMIGEALPPGTLLFTGGLRCSSPDVLPFKIWNSLLVLNKEGETIAYVDKSHLVPFGEYLPWRKTLDRIFGENALKKITAGTLDYSPGEGPKSICLPCDLPPFTGLVCYEVVFPGAVVSPTQPRPGWMINVTNDAWYGESTGPYQHLEAARFRAIEEGIPLVRVANSGISAVFDAYGEKVGSLPLNTEGVLDVMVPPALEDIPFYARWGDQPLLSVLLLLVVASFSQRFFRKKIFR